jgi:nucleoside 2-deoxyribosyltransferase
MGGELEKEGEMAKCFVIQPFDNDKFDKRFKDTYKVAIEECGLEAYRIDKDPKSQVPIDDIDIQLKNSDICLAEITLDNPNVWFELGLAIAYNKPVIMICSDERQGHFPFDVQHRSIIKYTTGSASDFNELKEKIKEKIKALMQIQQNKGPEVSMSMAKINTGLESHEIKVLTAIATSVDSPELSVSLYNLKKDFDAFGLTKLGIILGVKKLMSMEFINFSIEYDNHNNEDYYAYSITDKGMNWLMDNKNQFILEDNNKAPKGNVPPKETDNFFDDIPF